MKQPETPDNSNTTDCVASETTAREDSYVDDDIDIESNDESSDESSKESYPIGYVAQLKAKLKEAEEKADMLQTRFKQAQLDLNREADELRNRLRRNSEERLETAKSDIYKRMLEFVDNLERAIKFAETNADTNTLLEGVKATHQLLLRDLENNGVSQIIAVGESFNPELHEAVDILAVASDKDNQVTAVYKAGYKLGNKLLRPAVVQVGRSQ